MNKLKNKVFFTIFIILNIFSLSILIVYNVGKYNDEYMRINRQLRNDFRIQNRNFINNDNNVMRFMDADIYTVLYSNTDIIAIISHTTEDEVSDEIEDVANNIINGEKEKYIGFLYTSKYSFNKSNNSIIIIDNAETNKELLTTLKLSFLLLIIIEIISYIISTKLSLWIIKPVEETFDKQKQFIADASHELKTPLAVIMASADTLEKDNNKKWIKNIQNESERMNKLITNLLDLSKVENNNIKENVNLSKLVEKSLLTLESLMFEKNIKLNYKIDENIEFECNSDEMKQLMGILMDNAIKHSHENGNVTVNLTKDKDIILEVKNKGDKIPEGEEEKIFERFYRVDKARNRDDNRYGLGLAIAKSIVTKHNGEITANSSKEYTTFRIVFKK